MQPIHILVRNVSSTEMRLPKHMVVAYETDQPTSLIKALFTTLQRSPRKTIESVDTSAFNTVHLTACEPLKTTAMAKRNQKKKGKTTKKCNKTNIQRWKTRILLWRPSIIDQQLKEGHKSGSMPASSVTQQNSSQITRKMNSRFPRCAVPTNGRLKICGCNINRWKTVKFAALQGRNTE